MKTFTTSIKVFISLAFLSGCCTLPKDAGSVREYGKLKNSEKVVMTAIETYESAYLLRGDADVNYGSSVLVNTCKGAKYVRFSEAGRAFEVLR